ncbi:GntR family transcriptional regulator [Streptomyces yaizuensis]|uniref:GntR family transcriptional regulator n=1 Tax=Streptomyces yaizuensis TaxID=2989713 RepID=A0ABQ5PB06_9ACTN|nr:GntR family transcriptional regulator [Streptomyces sp. YSPA8]GLF99775.1 GntR family transcriptional regulator [Streptomyces sp. YSPA8]
MSEASGYADIAAHFRQTIREGVLKPGDSLPSLRQVCEDFGVAQTTANRAFRMLKNEGLTLPKPGVGTVVAASVSDNIAGRVRTYTDTGRALSAGETSRITEVGTVGADEAIAVRLDIEPGTPVHVRRRVVSRDGVPVHLSSSYYPAFVVGVTPELTELVSTGASRELAAERLGVPQAHVLEEVTSRLATEPEQQALGLTGSVIVTQVIRTVSLTDGRVIEVAVKVASGATALKWSTPLV